MRRLLPLVFLVVAAPALAAWPTTPTQITGKVLLPNLQPASGGGTVTCALVPGATAAPDGSMLALTQTGTIGADGTLSLALYPNDALTPAGSYYTCTFTLTAPQARRAPWTVGWQILAGDGSPLLVGNVRRVDSAPGLPALTTLGTVTAAPSGACAAGQQPVVATATSQLCRCSGGVWACDVQDAIVSVGGNLELWSDLNGDGAVGRGDVCLGDYGVDSECDGLGGAVWQKVEVFDDYISGNATTLGAKGTWTPGGWTDADPQTGGTAIGMMAFTTTATINSPAAAGLFRVSTATDASFSPTKMLRFAVRALNLSATTMARSAWGGFHFTTDTAPISLAKDRGLFFWCAPSDDVDNSGAVNASDGNLFAVAMNGAVDAAAGKLAAATNTTVVNTGVSCTDGLFHLLRIEQKPGQASFLVDDVTKATITTNLPVAANGIWLWGGFIENQDATARRWNVDWFYYRGRR